MIYDAKILQVNRTTTTSLDQNKKEPGVYILQFTEASPESSYALFYIYKRMSYVHEIQAHSGA